MVSPIPHRPRSTSKSIEGISRSNHHSHPPLYHIICISFSHSSLPHDPFSTPSTLLRPLFTTHHSAFKHPFKDPPSPPILLLYLLLIRSFFSSISIFPFSSHHHFGCHPLLLFHFSRSNPLCCALSPPPKSSPSSSRPTLTLPFVLAVLLEPLSMESSFLRVFLSENEITRNGKSFLDLGLDK